MEFVGDHYDVYDDETVKQQSIAVTTTFLQAQLLDGRGPCA